MAPFKSTGGFSVGKLLGVFRDRDLTLNSSVRTNRYTAPKFTATGGLTYTPGNGYKYHVFTYPNSDTFEVLDNGLAKTVEVLAVGGGGGANGPYGSGGGGGGGIVYATVVPAPVGVYPVSVGNGGDATGLPEGGSGGPSTIFGLTALGGGGGSTAYSPGVDGGSGGGEGLATQPAQPQPLPAPSYTQYGNNGGTGSASSGSAGGGGAGQACGSYPPYTQGGAGAKGGNGQPFPQFAYPLVGLSPLIPVAKSPTNDHYGGGGGGWGYSSTNPNGGYGGGGDGHEYSGGPYHQAGVNNLGGGSGHWISPIPAPQQLDKPGGSGIVIVRYTV